MRNTKNVKSKPRANLKVIPLGGLGEIGKNVTVFEYGNEIVIIDCGIAFPEGELLGIDLVAPDMTYLFQNRQKIKALLLTHGHEDHIGSIPFLLKEISVPIYGSALTIGLTRNRLAEHNMDRRAKLNVVDENTVLKLGAFTIEFIRTNHSLADSMAIVLRTPVGIVLHSGDFKIDHTPIQGKPIDLQKFGRIGSEGVLLFLCESTNAEQAGYTISEKAISKIMDDIFADSRRQRLIIATFSSNTHRIQEIIDAAEKHNRKLVINGRSMVKNFETARTLGYLKAKDKTIIALEDIGQYRKDQVAILTTGSQGEPLAALSRIANGSHRQLSIQAGDKIVFSASPIPGNEKMVSNVINALTKKGAEVIYKGIMDVHVSGHAKQEEIKILHALVRPKYLLPVHGEDKHLHAHKKLAMDLGMKEKEIFVMDIGQQLELNRQWAKLTGTVPAGRVLIDGLGVGDVGNSVLKERKQLSEDGLIIISAGLDRRKKCLVSGPSIQSHGFAYVKESETLLKELETIAATELRRSVQDGSTDMRMRASLRDAIARAVWTKTKRNPVVMTTLVEV